MPKRSQSSTPPNVRDRKKIRRIRTLLNTLRDRIPNMNSTLKQKLGIQDRRKVTQLIDALNELDTDFTTENSEKLEYLVDELQLSELQHKYVKTLEKGIDAVIQIKRDTDIAEATSKVLLNCKYQGDDCVVKVMHKRVDKLDLFIETVINIFMSAVTEDDVNNFISCPDVITMGYLKNFNLPGKNFNLPGSINFSKKDPRSKNTFILVQEKISGDVFHEIYDELVLVQALQQLCRGLYILQDKYNFAHKDFHASNVMYNKDEEKVYIIDFGYSCFSVPDTNGSLQSLEGGYGMNQLDDAYKAHIPCINKSSDLCTLLLSLYLDNDYHWLYMICKSICKKYKRAAKEINFKYTDSFWRIHKKIPDDWKWHEENEKEIFYYWYIYELFQIDIDLTPKVLLRYLTKVENHIMITRLQAARRRYDLQNRVNLHQKLKF